jgi:hypothetical protein
MTSILKVPYTSLILWDKMSIMFAFAFSQIVEKCSIYMG